MPQYRNTLAHQFPNYKPEPERQFELPGSKWRRLRDASPGDAKADTHKAWADRMASALLAAGLERPAARVRDCAESLFFALVTNCETGEVEHKLRSAPYCHYRHCPICQWRRSLRNKAIIMSELPAILDQYPTAKFAMLTLTVRNCSVSELRDTIAAMNRGWQRLIQRKDWPALGWIRALEVTRAKDDTAHPHFHALLMLPVSYFSHGYVPTREWVKRWRQVMRLDYDPICDIRKIRLSDKQKTAIEELNKAESEEISKAKQKLGELISAVAEVAKYTSKADDLCEDPEWLAIYVQQMFALKTMTSGGVLKGVLKATKTEEAESDEDLIFTGEENNSGEEAEQKVCYHWKKNLVAYAQRRR